MIPEPQLRNRFEQVFRGGSVSSVVTPPATIPNGQAVNPSLSKGQQERAPVHGRQLVAGARNTPLTPVHNQTFGMSAQGRVIQLEFGKVGVTPAKRGGRRGEVKGYSKASRNRLLRSLNRLDVRDKSTFLCTLTFPDSELPTQESFPVYMERLKKRLERELPQGWFYLRVEWQQRKSGEYVGRWVPHVHIFCGGVPLGPSLGVPRQARLPLEENPSVRRQWGRDDGGRYSYNRQVFDCEPESPCEGLTFREWLAWVWYECVGSEDPKHLKNGVEVELVRDSAAVGSYAAKYCAKDEEEQDKPVFGRAWFVWGRQNLPLAPIVGIELSTKALHQMARAARKYAESAGHRHYGLRRGQGVVTFFGRSDLWVRLAEYYGGKISERVRVLTEFRVQMEFEETSQYVN